MLHELRQWPAIKRLALHPTCPGAPLVLRTEDGRHGSIKDRDMGHIALQHRTPARSYGQRETSSGKRQHGRSNVRAGMSDPPLDVKLEGAAAHSIQTTRLRHATKVPDARTNVWSSQSNCAANPRASLGLEVGAICHASALRKITHSSESSRTEKLPIAESKGRPPDFRDLQDASSENLEVGPRFSGSPRNLQWAVSNERGGRTYAASVADGRSVGGRQHTLEAHRECPEQHPGTRRFRTDV